MLDGRAACAAALLHKQGQRHAGGGCGRALVELHVVGGHALSHGLAFGLHVGYTLLQLAAFLRKRGAGIALNALDLLHGCGDLGAHRLDLLQLGIDGAHVLLEGIPALLNARQLLGARIDGAEIALRLLDLVLDAAGLAGQAVILLGDARELVLCLGRKLLHLFRLGGDGAPLRHGIGDGLALGQFLELLLGADDLHIEFLHMQKRGQNLGVNPHANPFRSGAPRAAEPRRGARFASYTRTASG